MATDPVPPAVPLSREIDLLLFEAAGAAMAVDASEVLGIVRAAEAEANGIPVATLDAMLTGSGSACPAHGSVLLFRDGDRISGLGVAELDSIQVVAIETIRLLPPLLASGDGPRPFWGVLPRGSGVVLLIDPHRLTGLTSPPAAEAAARRGHEP
jgi:hypothetical protein